MSVSAAVRRRETLEANSANSGTRIGLPRNFPEDSENFELQYLDKEAQKCAPKQDVGHWQQLPAVQRCAVWCSTLLRYRGRLPVRLVVYYMLV